MSRVILAPTESEKKFLMAGMRPSDIMEVARAGMAFYEHQRGIEVKHMKSRISKVENKLEASHQFHEEVLTHYKSHIAKLELEIEDLKRKEARNDVMANGPQSFPLALQYHSDGQPGSPITSGDQQIEVCQPGFIEEIDFEDLGEEDFAPAPPSSHIHDPAPQVEELSGVNPSSFPVSNFSSSSRTLQVCLERVDISGWNGDQSMSLRPGRSNQMVLGSGDRQLGSGGQWPGTRRVTRARQAQENNLYLGSRRGNRARPSIDVLSPLRLF